MKLKMLLLLIMCSLGCMGVFASEEYEADDISDSYVGMAAFGVLPQGGGRMHHLGGAGVRFGHYISDFFAIEAEGAWMENVAGLGVHGLWHFFGYERFDPFATFGVDGWIPGDVGPSVGLGAFYHLTDHWSLRTDLRATLGLDSTCQMEYSLSAGVQYGF